MKTYLVEFENNKAVAYKRISRQASPKKKEFRVEGNKRQIRWCIIEADDEDNLLAIANKFVKEHWGYALGLK